MQEHYRRLERMYLQGPIHQGIEGLRIQIEKGLYYRVAGRSR